MKIFKELRWALIAFASLIIFFGVCLLLVPTTKNELHKESGKSRATPNPNAKAVVSQYSILVENKRTETDISQGKSKKFEHKPSEVKKEESLLSNPSDKKLTDLVPGLEMSEEELRTLHAQQMHEAEMEESDPDAIVIPPENGQPGVTRRELMALHEQQMREAEMMENDLDVIVIPPEGGQPGVTRRELQALHQQQMSEIEMMSRDPDEIEVPPSEDGYPGLTRRELRALHREQGSELPRN